MHSWVGVVRAETPSADGEVMRVGVDAGLLMLASRDEITRNE